MNDNLEQEPEGEAANTRQIYTLARAVRTHKKNLEKDNYNLQNKVALLPKQENISKQIKEELTKNFKNVTPRQPRSHLPMKMIVSKMATRRQSNTENVDPASKLDLSIYKKHQLEPPPWRNNSLTLTKRRQPSGFEKIVSSMKKKCAESDASQVNNQMTLRSQNAVKHGLESLLSEGGCNILDTPRLDFNYRQLYNERHMMKRSPDKGVVFLDEDPLAADTPQTSEMEPINNSTNTNPLSPERSAAVPDQQQVPEFVWNPVVLSDSSKTPLFSNKQFESTNQLSPFRRQLPSCFDTPAWESSSTSSEHTVAEERLQLTIFSNRGDLSLFGHDFVRNCSSSTNPWD